MAIFVTIAAMITKFIILIKITLETKSKITFITINRAIYL